MTGCSPAGRWSPSEPKVEGSTEPATAPIEGAPPAAPPPSGGGSSWKEEAAGRPRDVDSSSRQAAQSATAPPSEPRMNLKAGRILSRPGRFQSASGGGVPHLGSEVGVRAD